MTNTLPVGAYALYTYMTKITDGPIHVKLSTTKQGLDILSRLSKLTTLYTCCTTPYIIGSLRKIKVCLYMVNMAASWNYQVTTYFL